jgi:hypothetical protein
MIMERLELASAVFWSLGTAFLDSITGGEGIWEVQPVDHCSLSLAPPGQGNLTTFFLDFTAGHGCAGVDWIGKLRIIFVIFSSCCSFCFSI